jgi:hypothetical protein
MNYTVHHGAVYNCTDSEQIAFIASKLAYRQAEGISRLPDGGSPDYLVNEVGLYFLNDETKQINKLCDFNDLVGLIGPSRSNWKSEIVFKDSVIYYQIQPVSDWGLIAKWKKESQDLARISELKKKYSKCYALNVFTKKTFLVDTTYFYSLCKGDKDSYKISLTALNKKLQEIPLADWGLIVQEVYPKSDEEYIEETIYLKNGSKTTRRAVIEQIISKMNKEEINTLLNKMDTFKNKLEGLEKTEYEIYSEDTYQRIQDLL